VRQAAADVPPHDLPTEYAFLGAPFLEPETLADVIDLRTDVLFDERHRRIHEVMRTLATARRPVDLVTVAAELRAQGHSDIVPHLTQLFEDGSIPGHLAGYKAELLEYWRKRRLLQHGMQLAERARNGSKSVELLDETAEILRELTASRAPADVKPLGRGAGEFLGRAFDRAQSYIEGLLSSDGSGWIAGEEKLSKSLYALNEAICLALGLDVCGRFKVHQRRRAFFLEEEDSPLRTQNRLRALLRGHGYDPDASLVRAELDRWLHVEVWSGFTFDDPSMLRRLEATLATFEPHVIYADVLRKLTSRDLNKADQMTALFGVLDDLRRRYGVVFRLLHHNRKSQGFRVGRGSQELGGSFVLGAWAEASLFFEPIGRKQGAVRVGVQTKDGAPVPSFRLVIEGEGPHHEPTSLKLTAEDDEQKSKDSEVDELVYQAIATLPRTEALAGKPGVLLKDVIGAVKRSDKTVRRAVDRLTDAGRCLVTGNATKRAALYGVNE
jgi:hypothetical protein